jgi:hypothetical protein
MDIVSYLIDFDLACTGVTMLSVASYYWRRDRPTYKVSVDGEFSIEATSVATLIQLRKGVNAFTTTTDTQPSTEDL